MITRPALSSRLWQAADCVPSYLLSRHHYRTMVVAVIAMPMVQMTLTEVVHVVAVRHHLTCTSRLTATAFTACASDRRADCRIRIADFQDMLIVMIAVHRVQMSVVNVIDVTVMPNRKMPAIGAVDVDVVFVCCTVHL